MEQRQDEDLTFLDVRSQLDARQQFLLPLVDGQLAGLTLTTRLGRWHGLPWALAYGSDVPSERSAVRFTSSSLRFRQCAEVTPVRLAERCWVAAATGLFDSVALVTNDVESARVALADRW